MKSITILRDKKLTVIVSLYTILYAIKIFIFTDYINNLPIIGEVEINFPIMAFIQTIVLLIVVWNVMSKLILRLNFNKDSIRIGFILVKSIKYKDINKIIFTDKIEIHTNGKVKVFPVYSIEDNKSKYEDIIKSFKEKLKQDIDVKQSLKTLCKNAYMNNSGEPDKFSSLLIIMWLYLFVSVLSLGNYVFFQIAQQNLQDVHPISVIISAVILSVGVITCIYTTNKHWRAPGLIKVYLWAHIVFTVIYHIETIIMSKSAILVWGNISLLINIAVGVLFALAVTKSLDISVHAKKSFIRGRLLFEVKKKSALKNKYFARSSWALRRAVGAMLLLSALLVFTAISISEYYSYDKKIYSSIQELIQKKYEKEETDYIYEKGYYLILARNLEDDRYYKRQLYLQQKNGEIICINKWHESTRDFNYVNLHYYPHLYVYMHAGNYIIVMETDDESGKINLLDSFGEIKPAKSVEDYGVWYFKVVNVEDAGMDYSLKVIEDDNEIYSNKLNEILSADK